MKCTTPTRRYLCLTSWRKRSKAVTCVQRPGDKPIDKHEAEEGVEVAHEGGQDGDDAETAAVAEKDEAPVRHVAVQQPARCFNWRKKGCLLDAL